MKIIRKLTMLSLGLAMIAALFFIQTPTAHAGTTGFQAGRIMDDAVMANKNSMSEAQIQTFLKSKNHCNDRDYDKYQRYTNAGFVYNWRDGHFVCMADESFNGESAAHIIWQAAQDYNINPQVIIVLLQKEQGLVTDTWPNTNHQYAAATGYDCPDNGDGCNNANAGFKTQIRKAANLFRSVLDGGWSNYPVGMNYIQYNPDPACGGSNVNILNRATSALYRYTPYQPNAGALAAGSGTAPCGAYGNRNFYSYFTDWFGGTYGGEPYLRRSIAGGKISPETTLIAGDFVSSPDGHFVTVMQGDGNLVTYVGAKAVWNTRTHGNYGSYARFQLDGNLVVYRSDNTALWSTGTNGSGANRVTLEDDGNLHIYANSEQKYVTTFKVSTSATNRLGIQLPSGEKLAPGSYLQSENARYLLVMQTDGHLVLYTSGGTALWASRTAGNPGAYATMQTDGNLVVYSSNGRALWNSYTAGRGASNLNLQTDGNLVIYTTGAKPTWSSGTHLNNYSMTFRSGSQIASGKRLSSTEYITSPDWRYRLVMQNDGNLVIYSVNKYRALWSSNTWGNPGAYATMQTDGNLVVYSSNGRALWNSYTAGRGASNLNLQTDGNLVIYTTGAKPTWSSGTVGSF